MKKGYEKPLAAVVLLCAADIITSSAPAASNGGRDPSAPDIDWD